MSLMDLIGWRGQEDAAGDQVGMKGPGFMRRAMGNMNARNDRTHPHAARSSMPLGRRGSASVLAMLYLVLFSTLAVGYFSATTMSVQISKNDRDMESARLAADSGLTFMRSKLGAMNLPLGTNSANLLSNVASQLGSELNGTSNMGSASPVAVSNGAIYIPSQSGYITLDQGSGTKFQAVVTQVSNSTNLVVTCRELTSSGSISSAVQLQFQARRGFSVVGLSSLTTGAQGGGRTDHIDSWNSLNGPYGTFPMNSNGNISSNGTITLGANSGTIVKGNADPGIGKSITIGTGDSVSGTTTPITAPLSYPTPVPGSAATTNNNANLPSTYFNSSTRDFIVSSGTSATSPLVLPGGVYYVNNLDWETAYINFTGPVVFYVTGTGTSKHPSNGFWTFNSHITTYQNAPANLVFEVTTNTAVQYDFDQPIYAAVYAPLSDVKTWGNADDYGSIVGNNLSMYTGWHVDESLAADGGGPYVAVQGSYIEVQ